jgi:hypothetical protein
VPQSGSEAGSPSKSAKRAPSICALTLTDPVKAVKAGFEMLKVLNLRQRGVMVISDRWCVI